MIVKRIFHEGKEIVAKFCFTLNSLRVYEENTKRSFFSDYEKLIKIVSEIRGKDEKEILKTTIFSEIMNFLRNVIPAFCTSHTIEELDKAAWVFEHLLNMDFVNEFMEELNKYQNKMQSSSFSKKKI